MSYLDFQMEFGIIVRDSFAPSYQLTWPDSTMSFFRFAIMTILFAFTCAPQESQASSGYNLPLADVVVVKKSERKMYLMKDGEAFKEYQIALGENPVGHKQKEGDEKTPEGVYLLDWRNDNSQFYRSIHVSYPNSKDKQRAKAKGQDPGGMIMIHGMPNRFGWAGWVLRGKGDWTNGCIGVSNLDMDEIWKAVQDGTPIEIHP